MKKNLEKESAAIRSRAFGHFSDVDLALNDYSEKQRVILMPQYLKFR
jgi:hypothetical protein